MSSTAIIVQARMGSTRLPGKVLKEVLGKPLLEYQIERLRRVTRADQVIVATTTREREEPIVDLCRRLGVPVFRGSEEDVLDRYYHAAETFKVDVVVRVTSDCPIIDPQLVDDTIEHFLINRREVDYVSHRGYPRGLDTEVFASHTLAEAYREAVDPPEREHVTPFIYRRPERYRLAYLQSPADYSAYRWTVDTPEDYELIRRILEALYPVKPCFGLADCLELMVRNPEWARINSHVKQKGYGE